jgi:hypothetical protein
MVRVSEAKVVSTARSKVRLGTRSEQSKSPEGFNERYISWMNLRYLLDLNAGGGSANLPKRQTHARKACKS